MRERPLALTLLCLMCLFEPVLKVLVFKFHAGLPLSEVIHGLIENRPWWEVVSFWSVYPIAGVAILKVRRWSYFFFIGFMFYSIYVVLNYEDAVWPQSIQAPLLFSLLQAALSLAVVIYLLFPNSQQPFFDSRIRWWEPMVRYDVHHPCFLTKGTLTFSTNILNISKSGVFVQYPDLVAIGDVVHLHFTMLGETISLNVKVTNKHCIRGVHGFGAAFRFESFEQLWKLHLLVGKLRTTLQPSKEDTQKAA